MLTQLRAHNYGCLRDVTVSFERLHALIGPNDSGKSTILRAVRTLGQLAAGAFTRGERWEPFDPSLRVDTGGMPIHVAMELRAVTPAGSYAIELTETLLAGGKSGISSSNEIVELEGSEQRLDRDITTTTGLLSHSDAHDPSFHLAQHLDGIHFYALTEDGLRRPSGFLPRHALRLSERGEGLPGLYFALRNDHEEGFERIMADVRRLFPTVKTVRAQPISATALELEVELRDGTRVGAAHVSTGLLYYLAFAALPEISRPVSTILLEEPENGLHPARIKQVMAVLRALTEGDGPQVIVTTHSPLVVNELGPAEVSVVRRPSMESGTVVTPIAETANFAERSGVYSLGELWLSYADGELEKSLFDASVR